LNECFACVIKKLVPGLAEKKKMNIFVFSENSIIKPSAFNLQSSLLRLRIQKHLNCAFPRLYSAIKLPNPKLNICIKLFKLTNKVEIFFKPGLVGCVPVQVGCNPVLVGAGNNLVFFHSVLVRAGNNLVGASKILVGASNNLVFFHSVLVGASNNLVGASKILVGANKLLVGVRNILVGDGNNLGKFPNILIREREKQGFLLKFFELYFTNLEGGFYFLKLNRNNLQFYYNN